MGKLALLLVAALAAVASVTSQQTELEWWQTAVVYQIYPRSFYDSDGDGVGDLKGITQQVSYIKTLGVDAIWISPFFKSPMKDFGYDISDFKDVDPIFGTMADFRELTRTYHAQGIKVVLDIVPNHSSDEHEWFQKSLQNISPYNDYYVWRPNKTDAQGNRAPPNNWISVFSGSAWEWSDERQMYYLHQFVPGQPDLNYENPLVRNEMLSVFKYWMDNGADAFRVDAVPHIYEKDYDQDEPKNPDADKPENIHWKPDEHRYWLHPLTNNLPGVFTFLGDVRALIDLYSDLEGAKDRKVMMVEAAVPNPKEYYGTVERPIAHFPFNFNLLGPRATKLANGDMILKADDVKWSVDNWWRDLEPKDWPTSLIGNHDNKRVTTRWGPKNVDAANMINILVPGTAVTYYGEEIGMLDVWISWKDTQDPSGCQTDPDRYEEFSRDPARTPMQWHGLNTCAGFCDPSGDEPWLPIDEANYKDLNVLSQTRQARSHLDVYKKAVSLRKTNAWRSNSHKLETKTFLDYGFALRRLDPQNKDSFVLVANMGNTPLTTDLKAVFGPPSTDNPAIPNEVTVWFANLAYDQADGSKVQTGTLALPPYSSVVFKLDP